MEICQALRLNPNSRIAWVGAGGKTTSMFRTASQYGRKILVSATAHLSRDQIQLADRYFIVRSTDDVDKAQTGLVDGINLFVGEEGPLRRMQGLSESQISRVKDIAEQANIPLLIEADGARMRPLKAPASHEPPIPSWVSSVVVVAGLSAVGNILNDQNVFRPELFAEMAKKDIGSEILLSDVCDVLMDPVGGLKNIPENAEKIILLNQIDAAKVGTSEIKVYRERLLKDYHSILAASMKNKNKEIIVRYENVAGVILSAGRSERFGEPKQLLDWKGKPFIRQVAEMALASGLCPIVVVLGAVIEPIEEVLRGLPIEATINNSWAGGLSTSIRKGIEQIENRSQGAVFLMSDMPQVSNQLVRRYLEFQSVNDYQILVPRAGGQRTNPAMFDKRCFSVLKELKGDVGGRQIFDQFKVKWMDLESQEMAMDVDTPEDYSLLMKKLSAKDDE